jgi:G3E family GTPase
MVEDGAGLAESARIPVAAAGVVENIGVHVHHAHDGSSDTPRDHDHGHDHSHDHSTDALGFSSWSLRIENDVNVDYLAAVLDEVCAGRFGVVERLKGLAHTEEGFVRFDVAGGRPHLSAYAAATGETARVMAIGVGLAEAELTDAFSHLGAPAPALLAAE